MKFYNIQFFGGSGAGSRRRARASGNSNSVRGVSQEQIDLLRGARTHKNKLTAEDIQADYAKVGINISSEEAQKTYDAIYSFTGDGYDLMRYSYDLERQGTRLSKEQQEALSRYKICMEYCRIAPTYKPSSSQTYLYRGIQNYGDEYSQKLLDLKVGDSWDVDKMPTSFTTSLSAAKKNSAMEQKEI